MKRFSTILVSASMAAALLLSGCASDQMKKDISDARSMAEQAQASADRAQRSADAAASAASAAQSCCDENKTRVDRAFRKAMNK
jgi:outer membrane murein-binding lipoprotein Lpp